MSLVRSSGSSKRATVKRESDIQLIVSGPSRLPVVDTSVDTPVVTKTLWKSLCIQRGIGASHGAPRSEEVIGHQVDLVQQFGNLGDIVGVGNHRGTTSDG